MHTVLHLLTTPPDELTRSLLELQQASAAAADRRIEILDLSGPGAPDYDVVLDRIFQADSVSTW